ncbi:MAG: DUF4388 domain-containing protein [Desulfopila sp.]
MSRNDFTRSLSSRTAVQTFMTRLLAGRLRRLSLLRSRDLGHVMSGRIGAILPAELLQIFNMHQKTGMLTMEMASGTARVVFRQGAIVSARYGHLRQTEAVYSILAENKG